MRRSRWLDPAAESVVIATSVDLGNFWRIGMVCVFEGYQRLSTPAPGRNEKIRILLFANGGIFRGG